MMADVALAGGATIIAISAAFWQWPLDRKRSRAAVADGANDFTVGDFPGPSKPRVRISRDGWIRNAGGEFPFHPGTLVELAFDDGRMLLKPHGVETAGYWHESWWKREAKGQGRNIAFYRIVRLAPPVTTAPRIAR